jgi:hypothetical protein
MQVKIRALDNRVHVVNYEDIKGLVPAFTLAGEACTAILFANAIILTGGAVGDVGQALASRILTPSRR